VLEKAIFNEVVINARHDWGTRYLEWTSKAFTLDRCSEGCSGADAGGKEMLS